RHLHHVARRHFRYHAAAAGVRRAADASLHDPARRLHAPDRPTVRDRHADRTYPEDFARLAAERTNGHHSRWGLKTAGFEQSRQQYSGSDNPWPAMPPLQKAGSMPIRAKTGWHCGKKKSSIQRARSSTRIIISGIAAASAI